MKLIKKLQTLFLKNRQIVIGILIILGLSSIIFYLDIFNLNFLNKEKIIDLKTDLLEKKEDLNLEEKENLSSEKTSNNNNLYKYLIGASCIVLFILIIYFNIDNNQPPSDKITMLHEILSKDKNFSEKDIMAPEMAQLNDHFFNPLEYEATKKIVLDITPKGRFVDEVLDLRKQLEELAKK